ncbi:MULTISPECIES: hypothetical protein [unclassified Gordonia (in: high G+C Gram-positive bacteria)]|uniref:hypothetical protein n=1 Tax=unclassified Gordonia (in: high G+C Gram-positive bacteria) TaxID=2657482 RepID=UPI00071D0286|nr:MULTISPECIES: hypothetical protein [unclassified Gordonia (in: high G+C Gram-positive bacteria)]KSU60729.1 hypothetical protein AS181_02805 [Gordonia sp. SGD-V-85]MCX2752351.1 hypothetical protein [Gordonia sp. 4N]SCB85033.1 hypothetical protein GA0061091_102150 [Gordonia sp. v-85]
MDAHSAHALSLFEQYVTDMWGERCETTDLEDFPELETENRSSRCGVCVAWEEADQFREWLSATPKDSRSALSSSTVTRFEVIDHTTGGEGRAYVKYDVSAELSYQDDGRTLKVFVGDRKVADT